MFIEFSECYGSSQIEIYKSLDDVDYGNKKIGHKKRRENGNLVLYPNLNRESGAQEHQMYFIKVFPIQLGAVDHKRRQYLIRYGESSQNLKKDYAT